MPPDLTAGLPWLPPPDIPQADKFHPWGDGTHLKALFGPARSVAVLTGAGLSAASGLHTYRGKDGRWKTEEPVYHQEFLHRKRSRLIQWQRSVADYDAFAAAKPNEGHAVLADWVAHGATLITQNIDDLHGRAARGGAPVLELHGNGMRAKCVRCGHVEPIGDKMRAAIALGKSPACDECGYILKPDIVLFGGSLDRAVMKSAVKAAEACDLFVAVGTSLQVQPAAGLVEMAKRNGAKVAILVDAVTPYHGIADLLIAGDAVSALVATR